MKVPPLIRTTAEVREKIALLEALGDIQAALSVLDQPIDVTTHPADQQYHRLQCDLTPLQKESEEYKVCVASCLRDAWYTLALSIQGDCCSLGELKMQYLRGVCRV